MRGASRNLVRLVEAAYQLDIDQQEWLDGLAGVLGTMGGAAYGLMVYEYDASKPEEGVHIPAYALHEIGEEFAQGTLTHHAHSPPDDTRRVYHSGIRCGTTSELFAPAGILPRDHESFSLVRGLYNGVEDAWGLSASNPDGRGVGIAAPLYEVTTMSDSMRELWGLVGVHLATAYRLRRGGDDQTRSPDAVFEPNGRLVHANGIGFDSGLIERTSEAVRRRERARSSKVRRKPQAALQMWKGLVEGRWSLVEQIDGDGRRLVVAHENEPPTEGPSILTKPERQVAAYVAQGDSIDRIAYSLGFDRQRVVEVLEAVMEKLDAESRDDVTALFRTYLGR